MEDKIKFKKFFYNFPKFVRVNDWNTCIGRKIAGFGGNNGYSREFRHCLRRILSGVNNSACKWQGTGGHVTWSEKSGGEVRREVAPIAPALCPSPAWIGHTWTHCNTHTTFTIIPLFRRLAPLPESSREKEPILEIYEERRRKWGQQLEK